MYLRLCNFSLAFSFTEALFSLLSCVSSGAGFVQSREEAFKHTALVDLSTKISCRFHNVRLETRTFRLKFTCGVLCGDARLKVRVEEL